MYAARRQELLKKIDQKYAKPGLIIIAARYENHCCSFRQDSSFFYLTGISEPGCVFTLTTEGKATLYIPQYQESRKKWIAGALDEKVSLEGFDDIRYLGAPIRGYQLSHMCDLGAYQTLIAVLQDECKAGRVVYSLCSHHDRYDTQQLLMWRLRHAISYLDEALLDVTFLLEAMRRKKTSLEIDFLRKAIHVTHKAQRAAQEVIALGKYESDVVSALESEMRKMGARTAFPSIVAGGSNSCVLHYTDNNAVLDSGAVVVVDIGAQVEGYCADITRTYPVSGAFTSVQQDVYNLVLDAQAYAASLAQPGWWLSNKNEPEKSLHHAVVNFFSRKNSGSYFTHGLGHFLGLDVHDVGDYTEPLAPGDVITIEPGLYIKEKALGIRIEDDYLITPRGSECLSADIPK